MFYMHDVGWGWWLVMSIGMVAFWVLVIYGTVLLFRSEENHRRDAPSAQSPKEILKRRLAAGEISIEEYRRLLECLDDDSRHPMAA